jgi:hypothetical protein
LKKESTTPGSIYNDSKVSFPNKKVSFPSSDMSFMDVDTRFTSPFHEFHSSPQKHDDTYVGFV